MFLICFFGYFCELKPVHINDTRFFYYASYYSCGTAQERA